MAFVRFRVPDTSMQEQFLHDFGLELAGRANDVSYFCGWSASPFLYALRSGPSAFEGFAFEMGDREGVERLSAEWSAPVEALAGPGNGIRCTTQDPDGFQVEAVHFAQKRSLQQLRPSLPANVVDNALRVARERRLSLKGAQVCRLGHVVLKVTDLRRSEHWYKAHFDLLTSDRIVDDKTDAEAGVFLRLNRGATFTDHHSLFLIQADTAEFHHAAFEVRDLDDLMVGHDRLKASGHRHHWGVGRHLLGGQVFDYWRDPCGFVLEHWTDGDVFDAAWGSRVSTVTDLKRDTWRTHSSS
jgi:catechol 2,3-dioxygenase-like lactoylglutathione lyase family enzyme